MNQLNVLDDSPSSRLGGELDKRVNYAGKLAPDLHTGRTMRILEIRSSITRRAKTVLVISRKKTLLGTYATAMEVPRVVLVQRSAKAEPRRSRTTHWVRLYKLVQRIDMLVKGGRVLENWKTCCSFDCETCFFFNQIMTPQDKKK